MSQHEFDVVVIGTGPGGEYTAAKPAAAGLRRRYGGDREDRRIRRACEAASPGRSEA